MTINDRLKLLRKTLGLNQTDFGKCVSLSQSHLTSVEKGERSVTERTIKIICSQTFNDNLIVNEEWLRFGSGELVLEKDADQEFAEAINQINFHGDELIKKIIIDYMHLNDENRKKAKQYILDLAAAVKKDKSI